MGVLFGLCWFDDDVVDVVLFYKIFIWDVEICFVWNIVDGFKLWYLVSCII